MRWMLFLVPVVAVVAAHQYVQKQITLGHPIPIVGAPVKLAPIDPNSFKSQFTFDPQEAQRWNGDRIADQTRLFNQHMEDIRNYARNPHGVAPFP